MRPRVGITGHQELQHPSDAIDAVRAAVLRLRPSRGITSLAAGADQAFAEICLSLSIPLKAVIPAADYAATFAAGQERENYQRLLNAASETVTLPFGAATEDAFYAAGRWIVDNSDDLIAVWDGQPSNGLGGTADIVHYANEVGRRVHIIHHERSHPSACDDL